ncbi:MAG: DNA adenine methylase [Rikenellaceae bacterium]
MKDCKPFVKWVGGKTQLLKNIENSLPSDFAKQKNISYIEPFVGGGAVLFWMLQNFPNIHRAVINDINPDLTGAYLTIKQSPRELIEILAYKEAKYFELMLEDERKEFFLEQRTLYNESCINLIERTALFIFLNRTCFNGLYRVNKKGKFNVPFGRYANPKICDSQTILADSELLQRVEILTGDFSRTLNYASQDSFFYFDPPYKPISKTSSFTTYSKEDFGDADQIRLGDFCKEIARGGSKFMLSNSDTSNSELHKTFFDDLYSMFKIERVQAKRMINSNAAKRGNVSELLISNINVAVL